MGHVLLAKSLFIYEAWILWSLSGKQIDLARASLWTLSTMLIGQLLCFHLLLNFRGITTYEFWKGCPPKNQALQISSVPDRGLRISMWSHTSEPEFRRSLTNSSSFIRLRSGQS